MGDDAFVINNTDRARCPHLHQKSYYWWLM